MATNVTDVFGGRLVSEKKPFRAKKHRCPKNVIVLMKRLTRAFAARDLPTDRR